MKSPTEPGSQPPWGFTQSIQGDENGAEDFLGILVLGFPLGPEDPGGFLGSVAGPCSMGVEGLGSGEQVGLSPSTLLSSELLQTLVFT